MENLNKYISCILPVFLTEQVDEKTRTSMYKLRQTWAKVIPNNKLFALDVRVKRIDPAWPVTAKPPDQGSIHVNPKFLVSQVIAVVRSSYFLLVMASGR